MKTKVQLEAEIELLTNEVKRLESELEYERNNLDKLKKVYSNEINHPDIIDTYMGRFTANKAGIHKAIYSTHRECTRRLERLESLTYRYDELQRDNRQELREQIVDEARRIGEWVREQSLQNS